MSYLLQQSFKIQDSLLNLVDYTEYNEITIDK